jgi:predicted lipid-binding transport protein (Tim44 family)
MKSKLVTNTFVSLITVMLFTGTSVEAKKLGSGNSVGRQSSTVTKNQSSLPAKPATAPVSAAKPATPAPAPVAPPSAFGGMGGILGGIAAGIGMSYLFSHMGLGGLAEGIASMISGLLMFGVLSLIGFWIYKKFIRKEQNDTTSKNDVTGVPAKIQ